MNVVWLKRDARLLDHEPLCISAAREEPTLLLYVYEDCHLTSDTYHEAHHTLVNDGLADLDAKVKAIADTGGGIVFRKGCVVEALTRLHADVPIRELLSHREVGNATSRSRDSKVAAWAAEHGVTWTQCRQDGVSDVRHEELDQGSWAKKWSDQMTAPAHAAPRRLRMVRGLEHGALLDAHACGVVHLGARPSAQRGGETRALATLESFLGTRGERYSDELSSPLSGWDSCSRLSPYLAWGHVSLRHVFQSLSARQEELRLAKKIGCEVGGWLKSLAALGSRLRWRSHFSQKLHDQPSIEFESMVQTYDALRADTFDETKYDAWLAGRTGYPMVDACMRSLHHSGWLNFRMRCMLVSFACYQLRLDWRRLTPAMARLFLDYEPGIHYPQFQMQAGTTGINANRIYSPIKQAEEHAGADFEFIRRWVPELESVPAEYVAQPHTMPPNVQRASGCVIGENYPAPIVDNKETYRFAVAEFARVRAQAETKAQAAEVYDKHGSRKRPATAGANAGGDSASGAKRPALGVWAADDGSGMPPFTVANATTGRATCRQCGGAIAKGALRASSEAWARGGKIAAHHHLECFVAGLTVELCASNRGKCRHSGTKFVKGSPRIGYPTTGGNELGWLCLDSAAAMLPPILAEAKAAGSCSWAPEQLRGVAALRQEQREKVMCALSASGSGYRRM